jgi:hypothetical protein
MPSFTPRNKDYLTSQVVTAAGSRTGQEDLWPLLIDRLDQLVTFCVHNDHDKCQCLRPARDKASAVLLRTDAFRRVANSAHTDGRALVVADGESVAKKPKM